MTDRHGNKDCLASRRTQGCISGVRSRIQATVDEWGSASISLLSWSASIVSAMTRTWVGNSRGVYGYYQDVVEPPPSAQPRLIGVEVSTVDHMKLQLKRLCDDTPNCRGLRLRRFGT